MGVSEDFHDWALGPIRWESSIGSQGTPPRTLKRREFRLPPRAHSRIGALESAYTLWLHAPIPKPSQKPKHSSLPRP